MIKFLKKLDKHWVMIIGIFLVSLGIMLPLFIQEYHVNNDTMYHITTIASIKDLIRNNIEINLRGINYEFIWKKSKTKNIL